MEMESDSFTHFIEAVTASKTSLALLLAAQCLTLYLSFKAVVAVGFGELREAEVASLKERLVNYTLFKIVFVGIILEPDTAEMVIWLGWFSVLGLLKMVGGIARDRYDHLEAHVRAPRHAHCRVMFVLLLVFVANSAALGLCAWLFASAGPSV